MPLSPYDMTTEPMLQLGGGVDFSRSSTVIEAQKSPNSINFIHRRGKIYHRDVLSPYNDGSGVAVPSATNAKRVVGLGFAGFENGNDFLMIHTEDNCWSFNGTTTTDVTPTGGLAAGNTDADRWDTGFLNDNYFACNGKNELIYWSGSGLADDVTDHASYSGPAALIGRYVLGFAGRVFMGYTTEGGLDKAVRLRWSSDAGFYLWDTAVDLGAGSVDLADTPGKIVGVSTNGNNIVVYKEDAVVLGVESGDLNAPIQFPTWLPMGCLTGFSVQSITPNTQIFLGRDNVYALTQGQAVPIGVDLSNDIYDNLNYDRLRQVVSFTRPSLSLYYLVIPTGTNDWASRAYVYNWAENHWHIEDYTTEMHSATRVSIASSVSIDSQSQTIDSESASFDSFAATSAPSIAVIGTTYDSSSPLYRVHKIASGTTDAYVTTPKTVTATWESKDARFKPDAESTLYDVIVDYTAYSGGTLVMDVSVDRGASWDPGYSATLASGTNKRAYFWVGATGLYHRIRFTATDNVEIHHIDVIHTEREEVR